MAGKFRFKRTAIIAAAAAAAMAAGGTVHAFAAEGYFVETIGVRCLGEAKERATVTVWTGGERDGVKFIQWESSGNWGYQHGRSDWFDSEEQSFEVKLHPGDKVKVSIRGQGRQWASDSNYGVCG
jgi:hypothetical protein